MATLVGIFSMTHSPFCYMPPEKWNDVRASRSLRADVPVDDLAGNRAKAARISLAFTALRSRLAALAAVGMTELCAHVVGSPAQQADTRRFLGALSREVAGR